MRMLPICTCIDWNDADIIQIPSQDDSWLPHHHWNRCHEQQGRAPASASHRPALLRQAQRLNVATIVYQVIVASIKTFCTRFHNVLFSPANTIVDISLSICSHSIWSGFVAMLSHGTMRLSLHLPEHALLPRTVRAVHGRAFLIHVSSISFAIFTTSLAHGHSKPVRKSFRSHPPRSARYFSHFT